MASAHYRKSLLAAAALALQFYATDVAQAAELLMFERGGCVWCQRWNREIAPVYERTDEARLLPLRRIDLDRGSAAGVALASPVRFTPTFVVVDGGREVGRIVGYSSDESFWGLLSKFAARLRAVPERS